MALRLFFCAFPFLLQIIHAATILDIVRNDPQLSTFASIIAKTGGGIPNPDIEERFNGVGDQRSFTLFAPTNEAFSKISKPILDQISIPLNYPLLLSLLRTHFVQGQHNLSTLSQTATLKSVEGYPITLSRSANGTHIENQYYTSHLSTTPLTASNGLIHQISRFLDPYSSTFGLSSRNGTTIPTIIDKSPRQEEKTMTDLVLAEPLVSNWTFHISLVLSAILKRLGDRRGAESPICSTPHPFAVLPSNFAFALLPTNYTDYLRAPFNFALASHLLAWGISVPTCANFEDILSTIREKGKFEIFSHRADLNLTVTEHGWKGGSGKGSQGGVGELRVNNARVILANRCAGNGCIWIAERLVDPVFGMF